MKVYATCLASYQKGFLIGEWIELGIDEDELNHTIKRILKMGEDACRDGDIHEEYFLTDWTGEDEEFFQKVGEYTNVYELNKEVAHFNELDLDDSQKKCVSFLIDQSIVSNLDEALEKYEEVQIFEGMNFLDLSYQIVDEQGILGGQSQFVSNYFDYEAFASDLQDQYTAIDGDIFYYPY